MPTTAPLHCADCGYPKVGITNGPCPECGGRWVTEQPRQPAAAWTWLLTVGVFLSPVLLWPAAAMTNDPFALVPVFFFAPFAWMIGVIDVIGRSGMSRSLHPSNVMCVLVLVAAVMLGTLLVLDGRL